MAGNDYRLFFSNIHWTHSWELFAFFKQFLIENGLFEEFMEEHHRYYGQEPAHLDLYLSGVAFVVWKKDYGDGLMFEAFSWKDSKKGFDYWNNVYEKWFAFMLKKMRKKGLLLPDERKADTIYKQYRRMLKRQRETNIQRNIK